MTLDNWEVTLVVKGIITAEKPTDALDKAKTLMASGSNGVKIEEVRVTRV